MRARLNRISDWTGFPILEPQQAIHGNCLFSIDKLWSALTRIDNNAEAAAAQRRVVEINTEGWRVIVVCRRHLQ